MSDRLYTVAEVAERASLTEECVRRAIRSGDLDAFQFGRVYRVEPAAVLDWLERHRCAAHREHVPQPRPLRRGAISGGIREQIRERDVA